MFANEPKSERQVWSAAQYLSQYPSERPMLQPTPFSVTSEWRSHFQCKLKVIHPMTDATAATTTNSVRRLNRNQRRLAAGVIVEQPTISIGFLLVKHTNIRHDRSLPGL